MVDSPGRDLLKILPNELITNILAALHYRDLASCIQVCRRMADIIRDSVLLQYHLELGRCGMNDGPLSTLSILERRERLLAHDDAWKSLRWSACLNVFNFPDHGYYEANIAPGGILTFVSSRERRIIFVQIPSNLRGIPMRQWELSLSFVPHAPCALDLSEDILVVSQRNEFNLHFLSLSTGKPHPLAADPPLYDPLPPFHQITHVRISVAQNHVAVLIRDRKLRVWNWKTGQILLDVASENAQSISFIPENRILLATACVDDFVAEANTNGLGKYPALVMYSLDQLSALQRHGAAARPIAVFALEFGYDIIPVHLALHYHLNIHPYPHEVAVPFFSAPTDHLIALQVTGMLADDRSIVLGHVLLIPLVRLGSTTATDVPTRYVPWNNWGFIDVRRVPDPTLSGYFRHALAGSQFIPRPETRDLIGVVDVWDFSRAGVALEPQRCDRESLPCVQKQLVLPSQIDERVVAMISEDAIVIREARSVYLRPMVQLTRAHRDAISSVRVNRGFISSFSRVLSSRASLLERIRMWNCLVGRARLAAHRAH
ncbi:hypothetical protein EDB89DRAFT_2066586 [Lactarius sanguifluus]|nr:hypothetical protein EDB89DRAFT_2066586 [Lactarius sanguifluus]